MSDTSPEVPPNPLVPDETPELATMRAQLEAIERQRAQLFNLCVALVAIAGTREVVGLNGLVNGPLDAPGAKEAALARLTARGFGNEEVANG